MPGSCGPLHGGTVVVAAIAMPAASTSFITVQPVLMTLPYGVALATAEAVLWDIVARSRLRLTGWTGLLLLAAVAVLLESIIDIRLAWRDAGVNGAALGGLATAGAGGGSRLVWGIGWLVAIISLGRRPAQRRSVMERPERTSLVFMVLAALYSLTVYLRGTMTVLDSLMLLSLLCAYVVSLWRHSRSNRGRVGGASGEAGQSAGTMLAALAVAIALLGWPLANGVLASQAWILGLALLVLMKSGACPLTFWLSAAQVLRLTLVLGSLPVASALYSPHLGSGMVFDLDDRVRAELLVTATQTLFLAFTLAKTPVPQKTLMALISLLALQSLFGFPQSGTGQTAAPAMLAVLYLGAAFVMVNRDRERWRQLLEVVPVGLRGVSRRHAQMRGAGP